MDTCNGYKRVLISDVDIGATNDQKYHFRSMVYSRYHSKIKNQYKFDG